MEKMQRDRNKNIKYYVYGDTIFRVLRKQTIIKANETSLRVRQFRRMQERRENELVQETISADGLLNTGFGNLDKTHK